MEYLPLLPPSLTPSKAGPACGNQKLSLQKGEQGEQLGRGRIKKGTGG